jgi:(p)ppGpp synthase/HD superfamily hydrolase
MIPKLDDTEVWAIAAHFHRDQKRTVGIPYIVHPTVVANLAEDFLDCVTRGATIGASGFGEAPKETYAGTVEIVKRATSVLRQASMLHDVVEDCPVTIKDLGDLGVKDDVLNVVNILTRRPEESYLDYLNTILVNATNPLGDIIKDYKDVQRLLPFIIKVADIYHNNFNQTKPDKKDKYDLALAYIHASLPTLVASMTRSGMLAHKDSPMPPTYKTVKEKIIYYQNKCLLDLPRILNSLEQIAKPLIKDHHGQ